MITLPESEILKGSGSDVLINGVSNSFSGSKTTESQKDSTVPQKPNEKVEIDSLNRQLTEIYGQIIQRLNLVNKNIIGLLDVTASKIKEQDAQLIEADNTILAIKGGFKELEDRYRKLDIRIRNIEFSRRPKEFVAPLQKQSGYLSMLAAGAASGISWLANMQMPEMDTEQENKIVKKEDVTKEIKIEEENIDLETKLKLDITSSKEIYFTAKRTIRLEAEEIIIESPHIKLSFTEAETGGESKVQKTTRKTSEPAGITPTGVGGKDDSIGLVESEGMDQQDFGGSVPDQPEEAAKVIAEGGSTSWWDRLFGGGSSFRGGGGSFGGGGASSGWSGSSTPSAPIEPGPPARSLAEARSRFTQELQNPEIRRLLMASTMAEVGGQGPRAEQAYIESVMNRALSRGYNLRDTLTNAHGHYYPSSTTSKLGAHIPEPVNARLGPMIDSALQGSNISNFATGNESGGVRSGGANIAFNPGTGERFVHEIPDLNWIRQITTAEQQYQSQSPQQQQQQPVQPQQVQQATIIPAITNERGQQQVNTGTIVLNDPQTGQRLGSYPFRVGSRTDPAHGGIPFGDYEVGKQIRTGGYLGPRFDLSDKYDPQRGRVRSELRIHPEKFGSAGCIGIIGDDKVYADFMKNMMIIQGKTGGKVILRLNTPEAQQVMQQMTPQNTGESITTPSENQINTKTQGTQAPREGGGISGFLERLFSPSQANAAEAPQQQSKPNITTGATVPSPQQTPSVNTKQAPLSFSPGFGASFVGITSEQIPTGQYAVRAAKGVLEGFEGKHTDDNGRVTELSPEEKRIRAWQKTQVSGDLMRQLQAAAAGKGPYPIAQSLREMGPYMTKQQVSELQQSMSQGGTLNIPKSFQYMDPQKHIPADFGKPPEQKQAPQPQQQEQPQQQQEQQRQQQQQQTQTDKQPQGTPPEPSKPRATPDAVAEPDKPSTDLTPPPEKPEEPKEAMPETPKQPESIASPQTGPNDGGGSVTNSPEQEGGTPGGGNGYGQTKNDPDSNWTICMV